MLKAFAGHKQKTDLVRKLRHFLKNLTSQFGSSRHLKNCECGYTDALCCGMLRKAHT